MATLLANPKGFALPMTGRDGHGVHDAAGRRTAHRTAPISTIILVCITHPQAAAKPQRMMGNVAHTSSPVYTCCPAFPEISGKEVCGRLGTVYASDARDDRGHHVQEWLVHLHTKQCQEKCVRTVPSETCG